MLLRTGFISPCLPSSAERQPSGPDWVHEIKHDGYRLMARRDRVGIRLLTRNRHDWAPRYPLWTPPLSGNLLRFDALSRPSTTPVPMSLTGSCFSIGIGTKALVWAFFVKEFARAAHLFPSSVS
jgi:hypothetical protein